MKARIERLGDRLVVDLPPEIVRDLGLGEGQLVDLSAGPGGIVIGDVDGESLDWGPDRGSEIIDDAYSRGEITYDDLVSGQAPRGR